MTTQKERWFHWYSQQLEHFIYEKGFTECELNAYLTNALTNTTTTEQDKEIDHG